MPLCIDNEKLLIKYKAIWTKIGDFKNIYLNTLWTYEDKFKKTKLKTYGDKIYTNYTTMKNPEILKFFPDHLKTKKPVSMQSKNYIVY